LTIAIASWKGATSHSTVGTLTAYGDRVANYLWSDTNRYHPVRRCNTNKLVVKTYLPYAVTVTGSNAKACAVSAAITIGSAEAYCPTRSTYSHPTAMVKTINGLLEYQPLPR